jgi:zinc protease
MSKPNNTLPKLDIRSLPGPDNIVLARENFSSPSIVVSGFLRAGALDEAREKAGLANLTALALMRGTKHRSFNDIYETIESIGASLSFAAGNHSTAFGGKCLAEDLMVLLDLLADGLRNASFPSNEIERLRSERLTGLAIRDQDTRARAKLAFNELAYTGHPYSIPSDGYIEAIERLTATDLQEFHNNHYGPQAMIICIVGAVKAEAALAAIEASLGQWTNPKKSNQPELPPLKKLQGILRKDVVLKGKSQCDLVLGVPGPSRFYPSYIAATLGNNILGRFGLYGRIGDSVRKAEGLAYYAYSTIEGGLGPGAWQVTAGVNPVNIKKAIKLIQQEIGRLVTDGVTEEELNDNQANFIGRLPIGLESNEGVALSLVHMEKYGLGLDYYQRYPELVAAVTREQILQAARQFLNPENLAIAVAGPGREHK